MLVSAVDGLLVIFGCRSWNNASNMWSMNRLGQSVAARHVAMNMDLLACR